MGHWIILYYTELYVLYWSTSVPLHFPIWIDNQVSKGLKHWEILISSEIKLNFWTFNLAVVALVDILIPIQTAKIIWQLSELRYRVLKNANSGLIFHSTHHLFWNLMLVSSVWITSFAAKKKVESINIAILQITFASTLESILLLIQPNKSCQTNQSKIFWEEQKINKNQSTIQECSIK